MGKQAFGFHEHQRYLATVRQEILGLDSQCPTRIGKIAVVKPKNETNK
jgi:hypothetical protein